MLKYILFDVDDTLYPRSSGVWPTLRGRIIQYMVERLGMTLPEAQTLRDKYLKEYGTSTRGLYLNNQIDIHDYLEYVHDVPLRHWLFADPELNRVLTQIPLEKCLFSNASRQHALNVARVLGIAEHFKHVFTLEDFNYISKPDPYPYRFVLERLQVSGAQCMFVEDSLPNLETAKKFGMTTVLVDGDVTASFVDFMISHVHDLLSVMQQAGVLP